ncbi:precorrin-2/cobalt-factor-2 C20-methyltransferase [Aquimarina sp. EL_43]|uniref:precorrin-2 C(20)-methyltransferase n=1 Tax=unclassified Aquimarina TaxID=2627091 RepID=UPI0018C98139|nr:MULTISPECIES: precorrin-2 C(20)-methyltransferase [unclassified Aquimarina]MBG6130286.1 precorrin-2/cobalt-factor-2 C20-methyltransferase [Aquimarina sp. EL_35]MBG6149066.1 precorrin-2/cobalt-factor-2 C20-methyltransferase [Aquimarina sp. EL_32]MBG6168560.1 precorrin-2/cobalt-factor-2 C20-methyltransferase [Aquimarina sp. EL_43]
MHTIYGIALGPGDPELLTLKALRILKEVDLIFYPGSITKDQKKSFVYPILQYHGLEHKELKGFFLNMSYDRQEASETYAATVKDIEKAYQAGKKIAIVCEGDISLYASFSYILTGLQELQLPVFLVPGINSFSLGASQHQIPLSLLNDKIAIVPRVKNIAEISKYFLEFDTVILMKIRSGWNDFHSELVQKDWKCYYCERLGTNQEYITTDLTTLTNREIPYFSLLIIKQ